MFQQESSDSLSNDELFNFPQIIFIGDQFTGKTSIIQQIRKKPFSDIYQGTL